MNNLIIASVAITLSIVTLQAYSKNQNDIKEINYSNSRVEYLESGDQILVPEGVTIVPGLPIVVSDDDMQAMAAVRVEIENNGFVDYPNRSPIAKKAIRGMRDELHARQNSRNTSFSSVSKVSQFDFKKVQAGKVSLTILRPESEAFIFANSQEITRAYSNTEFGDIYIHEMIGASMGVLDDSDSPNFYVDGAEGYRTTIRYENGIMATLVILRTEKGVTFVEVGSSFKGKYDDEDLIGFLSTLVTLEEG
ncbi:MAG: hypothetical protein JKY48_08580 [Flavobacteriales bacterium]|nr:hypothetical protein [Flavobacteriales bacterium]